MKPLSQYLKAHFQTKIPTKEVVFRRSKSVSIDDKRSIHSDVKHHDAEEERIQGWLANYNEGVTEKMTEVAMEESIEVKCVTGKERSQREDSAQKKEEDAQDKDSAQKKRKPSLWKILEDTAQTKAVHENRLSGLELLDTKQELISHQTSNDCKALTKEEHRSVLISTELRTASEPVQISSENSAVLPKRESPVKKTGQRKISDFFQRTS